LYSVFSPQVEEVTEKWRKPNNNEIHNLYSSMTVIMLITSRRKDGRVIHTLICKLNMASACKNLPGKLEDKIAFRRFKSIMKFNVT
jgi:hypothetical protein